MNEITPEQHQMAVLKLMAKQVELLEAIDWKMWQLYQKFGDGVVAAPSSVPEEDGLPSIDRIERLS